MTEWRAWAKGERPVDVPAAPDGVYEEWTHWGDWLGTQTVARIGRQYRPFVEARAFARGLVLKTGTEWRAFAKGEMPKKGRLPIDIPADPREVYGSEFTSMGDWLGTGVVGSTRKAYRSFARAREYARSLGLVTQADWIAFVKGVQRGESKLPPDVPAAPWFVYRRRWRGIVDWLGSKDRKRARRRA